MKNFRRLLLAIFLAGVAGIGVLAQTTAFTYRGRLTDAGNPANGNYDLQFKLRASNMKPRTQAGALPYARNDRKRIGSLSWCDSKTNWHYRASPRTFNASPDLKGD